jgi:hypothetical protein
MPNEATIAAFRASLHGELIEPGDPIYDAARKVYNGMIGRRPRLIAIRFSPFPMTFLCANTSNWERIHSARRAPTKALPNC